MDPQLPSTDAKFHDPRYDPSKQPPLNALRGFLSILDLNKYS